MSILLSIAIIPTLYAETDQEVEQKKQELNKIRRQIDNIESKRNTLIKKQRNIQKELGSIDRELGRAEKVVLDYNWIIHVNHKKIKKLRAELDDISAQLTERQQIMGHRLRAVFMSGKYTFLEVLLGSDSFVDLIRRYEFLKLVSQQDHELYENIRSTQELKLAKMQELNSKVGDAKTLLVEKKSYEKRIVQRHTERQQLLKSVKNDRGKHEQMIIELKAAAQRVDSFIKNLNKRREGVLAPEEVPSTNIGESAHYLAKHKGRIPWPVRGKILEGYGKKVHPRYQTVTFNKGINIQAKKGAGVKAVCDGKVAFADWFSGYGKLVIIDHDGGFYSLYAHLDQIKTSRNRQIKQGAAVGTVGNSGSTESSHLHFELRYRDKTVNPSLWLKR
ncbi:MAG: hypothetical protein B6244_02640 [Candidatus Cloacimonetes bacterium 4572_55]|nr:MAG: hypothetical protein B6244_02640 [Candidatus Cloacimonetes bacterium 4572_55]